MNQFISFIFACILLCSASYFSPYKVESKPIKKTIYYDMPEEIDQIDAGDRLMCTHHKNDTIRFVFDRYSYSIMPEDDSITIYESVGGKIIKRFSYNSELGQAILCDNE